MLNRKQYLNLLENCDIVATDAKLDDNLAYEITTKYCRCCPAYVNCNNNDCFYFIAYKQIKKK